MSYAPLDRQLVVPPGQRVATGYVPVDQVRLACHDRMAVGDVERPYQRRIQLAPAQPWPPPVGAWKGEGEQLRFVIEDGRHDYVAALMLGYEWILVAWLELDLQARIEQLQATLQGVRAREVE